MTHPKVVHDPAGRSLRKAGRTAVVMSAGFLFGLHVVGNAQFAVIAAFTAAAVLGIADFSGNRGQRLGVTATTLAAGAVLLAIGTAVSTNTAAASTTMFVVTLMVSFSAVFSGYFAAASSAVIVFYVVATGVEGPASVIGPREAGLAFGGALSLLAAGWLWPSRATADSRLALAQVYRGLARQIGELVPVGPGGPGDDQPDPTASGIDGLAASILTAERALAASAWRPDGLAGPHKARMYMLQGARRMTGLVDVFGDLPVRRVPGLEGVTGELVAGLAAQLERCADGVATYGRVLPDPPRVERVRVAFTEAAHRHFAEALASGQAADQLRDFAAWYFVLQQLCWGASLAAVHCRAMHNVAPDLSSESEHSALVKSLTDGPSAAKWLRRARRNLSLGSVHFQNSLRLATGLALARLAVGVLGLQHGFWVGFATLVVLKTSAAGTRATAVQAAIGTAIGFGVSSALVTTFGVDAVLYSVLLPVVVFAAFYLPTAVNFVAGQACFTMVIVVLFNLLKPAGWTVGLIRVVDVLVGAIIGLVIGMAIWPRGAAPELSRVVGRLFTAGGGYARATVVHVLGRTDGGDGRPGDDGRRAWQDRVGIAAVDAEDVFSQYLAEPHQSDAPVMAWAALIATAHQLWFGSGVVALVPVATDAARRMPDLCDRVMASADALAEGYRGLGDGLAGSGSPIVGGETPPATPIGGEIDRSVPDATLTVLELEAWMAELARDLDHTGPALEAVGLGTRRAPTERSGSPARR